MFSLCLNKINCDIFVLYNDLWIFVTAEKQSNINFIFAYLNSAAVVAKKKITICGAKMHAVFNNNFFTHFTKKFYKETNNEHIVWASWVLHQLLDVLYTHQVKYLLGATASSN